MKCESHPYFTRWSCGNVGWMLFLLNLFRKLYISCSGKPLFLAKVHTVFHSYCLADSVMGVGNIQPQQQQQLLIEEQKTNDVNPLYSLTNTSHNNNRTHHSSVDT